MISLRPLPPGALAFFTKYRNNENVRLDIALLSDVYEFPVSTFAISTNTLEAVPVAGPNEPALLQPTPASQPLTPCPRSVLQEPPPLPKRSVSRNQLSINSPARLFNTLVDFASSPPRSPRLSTYSPSLSAPHTFDPQSNPLEGSDEENQLKASETDLSDLSDAILVKSQLAGQEHKRHYGEDGGHKEIANGQGLGEGPGPSKRARTPGK